jgi:hypothetical protein
MIGLRVLCLLALAFATCSAAQAEPATARYASAQLGFAQTELQHAGEASVRGELLLAPRLSAQARLDARLAWSMSESKALRRAAAEVHRRAVMLERSMARAAPVVAISPQGDARLSTR